MSSLSLKQLTHDFLSHLHHHVTRQDTNGTITCISMQLDKMLIECVCVCVTNNWMQHLAMTKGGESARCTFTETIAYIYFTVQKK